MTLAQIILFLFLGSTVGPALYVLVTLIVEGRQARTRAKKRDR